MKKLTAILSVIAALSCSAQHKIQKAQAFFTVSIPGVQLADEQGNRINPAPVMERFIYLECNYNGKPAIDTVLYNGIFFTCTVAETGENTATIGVKKVNGKPVILKAKKGNHVWRIDLLQADGKTLPHELLKKIVLKGKLDKTIFSYVIVTETELVAPQRY